MPKQLDVLDPTELAIIHEQDVGEIMQKVRDVLKMCVIMKDDNNTYLLLGIENQSDVHYAMPVRVMLYNALNYAK